MPGALSMIHLPGDEGIKPSEAFLITGSSTLS